MSQYTVVEHAYNYGITITTARRLNDAEKPSYAEWFRDYGFVGLGDAVPLNSLDWRDLHEVIGEREADGQFRGCGNQAWIITESEKETLISLNQQRAAEKAAKEQAERAEYLTRVISRCEAQGKLYTKEEAAQKRKQYNATYNEGGEGFMSHYYTVDEYERAKRELAEIRGEDGNGNH